MRVPLCYFSGGRLGGCARGIWSEILGGSRRGMSHNATVVVCGVSLSFDRIIPVTYYLRACVLCGLTAVVGFFPSIIRLELSRVDGSCFRWMRCQRKAEPSPTLLWERRRLLTKGQAQSTLLATGSLVLLWAVPYIRRLCFYSTLQATIRYLESGTLKPIAFVASSPVCRSSIFIQYVV